MRSGRKFLHILLDEMDQLDRGGVGLRAHGHLQHFCAVPKSFAHANPLGTLLDLHAAAAALLNGCNESVKCEESSRRGRERWVAGRVVIGHRAITDQGTGNRAIRRDLLQDRTCYSLYGHNRLSIVNTGPLFRVLFPLFHFCCILDHKKVCFNNYCTPCKNELS